MLETNIPRKFPKFYCPIGLTVLELMSMRILYRFYEEFYLTTFRNSFSGAGIRLLREIRIYCCKTRFQLGTRKQFSSALQKGHLGAIIHLSFRFWSSRNWRSELSFLTQNPKIALLFDIDLGSFNFRLLSIQCRQTKAF